ncbi:MAG: hypothetical protein J0M01_07600 [Dechloromonas sp.]|jgi:hypothetical protein|nr:hypothetical protein [Dechloromonas sp.]
MEKLSETIHWHVADDVLPNAEDTVLLCLPDAPIGERVWPGYYDYYGDRIWLLADGMPAGRVTHWAHFPAGPEGVLGKGEVSGSLPVVRGSNHDPRSTIHGFSSHEPRATAPLPPKD